MGSRGFWATIMAAWGGVTGRPTSHWPSAFVHSPIRSPRWSARAPPAAWVEYEASLQALTARQAPRLHRAPSTASRRSPVIVAEGDQRSDYLLTGTDRAYYRVE
jgi:hypothetical protein